jgi:hypothetical protein
MDQEINIFPLIPGVFPRPSDVTQAELDEENEALLELMRWFSRWKGHPRLGDVAAAVGKASGLQMAATSWADFHQPSPEEREVYRERLRRMGTL